MKKIIAIVSCLLLFVTSSAFAQESNMRLYRVYAQDRTAVRSIYELGFDIYRQAPGEFVELLAYPEKMKLLEQRDYEVEFIANSFKELFEGQLGAALSEYHDYYDAVAELEAVHAAFPAITTLDTIGYSVEGRAIPVLKVSDNPALDEDEPPILIAGCHHGNEILSVEATLYFIRYLVDNYGTMPQVAQYVNSMEIWFVPVLNPDGRQAMRRTNAHSVDLNRNYSFQFTAGGSHGPSPFSEPETAAMRDFAADYPPMLSLTYHTSGRLVLYSWTHTDGPAPDEPILKQIGGIVADSTNYTLRQGGDWYFTAGEYCDYMYGVHGTMAFTVEMYNQQGPPPSVIDGVMDRNLPGFIALLEQVNGSGITGLFTDATTGAPVQAELEILEVDDQGLLFPRISDAQFGRIYRYLTPDTYSAKVSAPGYRTVTRDEVPVTMDSLYALDLALEPAAYVTVSDYAIFDDSTSATNGNGDGVLNINETVGASLTLENMGQIEAENVSAIISTADPFVTVFSDSLYYGDLTYHNAVTSNDTAFFYVQPACPDGHLVAFAVSIADSFGFGWLHELEWPVSAPLLTIQDVIVHDTTGNGNGILDNGEAACLEVIVLNEGSQTATSVLGLLSVTDPEVSVLDDSAAVASLETDELGFFNFKVERGVGSPVGTSSEFQVDFGTAELYATAETFALSNAIFDNFEGIATEWAHASWNSTPNDHDDWQWGTPQGKAGDPSAAYSGEKCWGNDLGYDDYEGSSWNGYYQHQVKNYLRSPLFDCSGLTNVKLQFRRWLNVRAGDAARIKLFNTTMWESPAGGVAEYSWNPVTVDISSLADNHPSVLIVFELESNNDGNWAGGWNIDDVLITGDYVSGIADGIVEKTPVTFSLLDNYPNPFNPKTTISYRLAAGEFVRLTVYDVLGREVKTLVSERKPAGSYRVIWNGRDESGSAVPSGVYFYSLEAGGYKAVKKLLLVK